MSKQVLSKEEIQSPLVQGMDLLANVVKRTLGPGGLPIIIERKGEALDGSRLGPKVTKDGVSVAEECWHHDPAIDVAIQAVKAVCRKTNKDAGDGTTSAITLGQSLLHNMLATIKSTGENPQRIKEQLEAAAKLVVAQLERMAVKIDLDDVKSVATISANGDTEIGEIIQQAFNHVGAEGVVTVEEGTSQKVTVDLVEGYQFNRGAENRDSFFNNETRTAFVAESTEDAGDVAILIYDGALREHSEIIPALEKLVALNANGEPTKPMPPVIILANEFSRDVITFLLLQKQKLGFKFCAVKGPHVTDVRTGYYDDLAVWTGGTRLGQGSRSLASFELADIGYVKKAIVTGRTTTLYEGQGAEADILGRVEQLRAKKKLAESSYDAQVIEDRLAALTNGIAKIGVGGFTEMEIKEKYDRIEDALNACRVAIEGGVVIGGGVALLKICRLLSDGVKHGTIQETSGLRIMQVALMAPFIQILENVGLVEGDIQAIMKDVLDSDRKVFDSRNKVLVDAFEKGIIDPARVTRAALENAVSIAGLLGTAGGAIVYTRSN